MPEDHAARDWAARTPLHYAALDNDTATAGDLLAAGADPDARDRKDYRPLHFACQQGSLEVARLLLDAGAALDPVNWYGNTPLFVAVSIHRSEPLVELLLTLGADPEWMNNYGQTPVGFSRLIANRDVARFFTGHA